MLYVWDDIPTKLISCGKLPRESFSVEANMIKQNWLIICSFKPNLLTSKYGKCAFFRNFNVGMENDKMKELCNLNRADKKNGRAKCALLIEKQLEKNIFVL